MILVNFSKKIIGQEIKVKNLTNEIVDDRLKNTFLKRIDNYQNAKTKIKFKCLIETCNYIWETLPHNALNRRKKCPRCIHISLMGTNEKIDQRLRNRNIKRIDNYVNNKTKINFQCLVEKCGYIWKARPDNVLNKGSSCAKCGGTAPLNNAIIDSRLSNRNIKRINDYISIHTKINFQCLNENCRYMWGAQPNNIVGLQQQGCPKCSTNKNEKLINKILNKNYIKNNYHFNIKNIDKNASNSYMVDFYIYSLNLIIEYNGRQHYEPVIFGNYTYDKAKENLIIQQARDEYIRQFCKNNNITLIEIDGRIYKNDKLEKYIIDNVISLFNIQEKNKE